MNGENERERREQKERERGKKNRKNVDVMPITRVDGVGLGDWGSEGGSGRWWRKRGGGLTGRVNQRLGGDGE